MDSVICIARQGVGLNLRKVVTVVKGSTAIAELTERIPFPGSFFSTATAMWNVLLRLAL